MNSKYSQTAQWVLLLSFAFTAFLISPVHAKEKINLSDTLSTTKPHGLPETAFSTAYDPLIPQLFAFDKDNQIFAGICNVNNTIDIISYQNGKLEKKISFLVDNVEKRHDVEFIYRPQSVAIYENHVVFLASHRDSCYFAVLDVEGNPIKRFYFRGKATAFSYSPEAQELYIAGENNLGYDLAVLDVSKGFSNLDMDGDLSFHYLKPKKAQEMAVQDPNGIALAIIAMSVVFFSLMLLYLSFKGIGKALMYFSDRKARKQIGKESGMDASAMKNLPKTEELSGDVYAAIATAIFMYQNELHDEENTILTMEKVSRNYSPWNSKIYGMNSYFQINKSKR
ncbi:MAG: OadG family protein [Bacteroidales bacterium]